KTKHNMTKNYWKMMTILMVAVFGLGLASCGSDDDDSPSSSKNISLESLIGLWEGYSVKVEYQGKTYEETYDPTETDRLQVNSDHTYIIYDYHDGEWVMTETGTFTLKGNKLAATDDNAKLHTITIVSVTSDKFTFESSEEDRDPDTPGDQKVYVTYKRVR
ncbi:MAG: lipocalin family protein, partial [Prevotella sp.]|nr:lipocalin family protein [Prevotella sp.]